MGLMLEQINGGVPVSAFARIPKEFSQARFASTIDALLQWCWASAGPFEKFAVLAVLAEEDRVVERARSGGGARSRVATNCSGCGLASVTTSWAPGAWLRQSRHHRLLRMSAPEFPARLLLTFMSEARSMPSPHR